MRKIGSVTYECMNTAYNIGYYMALTFHIFVLELCLPEVYTEHG